jgi:deoxyhypusine synthase
MAGKDLRKRGINRIGNLLVPNDNYCKFEDWVMPILHTMADEQVRPKRPQTPTKKREMNMR